MTLSVPSASEFPTYIRQLYGLIHVVHIIITVIIVSFRNTSRTDNIYTYIHACIRLYIHSTPQRLFANRNKCHECTSTFLFIFNIGIIMFTERYLV